MTPSIIHILDIPVHSVTSADAMAIVREYMHSHPDQPRLIFTPNPEIILASHRQANYAEFFKQADLNLPDGRGLLWASRGKLTERVTGTDMMYQLLSIANELRYTIGFVLSREGLSSQADVVHAMNTQYPQCTVEVSYADETWSTTNVPDIIFVALGFPQQEEWSVQHRQEHVGTKIIMTVGGGVDYLTQRQHRAPLFFQQRGLEWLWRVTHQPKRLKRIWNATVVFPFTVWQSRRLNI